MSRRQKVLRPLLSWPGGSHLIAKRLLAVLPEHETFCEPFVGGGSLFFAKDPAPQSVIGDAKPWLIDFYEDARTGGLDACEPAVHSREGFAARRDGWEAGDACATLMTNKGSYDGNMRELGQTGRFGKTLGSQALGNLDEYKRKLRRAKLRKGDYAATMRDADSPDTLHYVDPPWTDVEKEQGSYAAHHYEGSKSAAPGVSLAEVLEVASEMDGKVIIAYGDSLPVRKKALEAGFRVYRMQYRSPHSKKAARRSRLLITNVKLKRKR